MTLPNTGHLLKVWVLYTVLHAIADTILSESHATTTQKFLTVGMEWNF